MLPGGKSMNLDHYMVYFIPLIIISVIILTVNVNNPHEVGVIW